MNGDDRLLVSAAPTAGFGPGDPYTEVWLSQLGPTAYLLWDRLTRCLDTGDGTASTAGGVVSIQTRSARPWGGGVTGAVEVTVGELSAVLGLGSPQGNQSRIRRALRRLERFGLVALDADGRCRVRTRLPLVPIERVGRLPACVRTIDDHARAATQAC